ncbi:MAG: 16S rRNA (uracil(1498)-N(3))-methyltransferase [Geodermatophilaceae bacterium]|nr:16S rRNA (uracil(1498)-N(3))-methyltransferase [Geodermatophilaceae bacterium]
MTPPLFLVDALPVADETVLAGDEGRHAARVRRIAVGERIDLGDGAGGLACCVVAAVGRDELSLSVVGRRTVPAPDPELVVVQALAKGDRGELAVELLTEAGVDEIVPWAASRSVTRWSGPRGEKSLQRWRSTAREATKQSRRAWLPRVGDLRDTAAVTALLAAADTAAVLHEDAPGSLPGLRLAGSGRIVAVVGPEGGLSDDELTAFTAAGAVAVHLGPAVLRTSTAGVVAVAALSARLGRWS